MQSSSVEVYKRLRCVFWFLTAFNSVGPGGYVAAIKAAQLGLKVRMRFHPDVIFTLTHAIFM
jgi:hypothetical protein